MENTNDTQLYPSIDMSAAQEETKELQERINTLEKSRDETEKEIRELKAKVNESFNEKVNSAFKKYIGKYYKTIDTDTKESDDTCVEIIKINGFERRTYNSWSEWLINGDTYTYVLDGNKKLKYCSRNNKNTRYCSDGSSPENIIKNFNAKYTEITEDEFGIHKMLMKEFLLK